MVNSDGVYTQTVATMYNHWHPIIPAGWRRIKGQYFRPPKVTDSWLDPVTREIRHGVNSVLVPEGPRLILEREAPSKLYFKRVNRNYPYQGDWYCEARVFSAVRQALSEADCPKDKEYWVFELVYGYPTMEEI